MVNFNDAHIFYVNINLNRLTLILSIFEVRHIMDKNPQMMCLTQNHIFNFKKFSKVLKQLIYLAYLFIASSTATATATVIPTIGLLPAPISPIISTCAGTDEEPAN